MTDSDLRELDGWIADALFDGVRITTCEADNHTIDEDGWCISCHELANLEKVAPRYTSDPAAFALVKREVERRGWDWEADYNAEFRNFGFTLKLGERILSFRRGIASEELVGCLAVKAAVEASSSSIST